MPNRTRQGFRVYSLVISCFLFFVAFFGLNTELESTVETALEVVADPEREIPEDDDESVFWKRREYEAS